MFQGSDEMENSSVDAGAQQPSQPDGEALLEGRIGGRGRHCQWARKKDDYRFFHSDYGNRFSAQDLIVIADEVYEWHVYEGKEMIRFGE